MKQKRLTLLFAILVTALPVLAVFNESNLNQTLRSLRNELQSDYQKMSKTQIRLQDNYAQQHQKMVDIMKECNQLSLMLYSQKQDYTFDLSYALEKVSNEYNDFNEDRMPYDRIVKSLDVEIERYARLLEALRRLPPERQEINVVPDSLAYRNDTLEQHLALNNGMRLDLEAEAKALKDSTAAPFILDEQGEEDRDSCIFYASELLKMYAESKDIVVADSIHYREAALRLKESYDYARDRYKLLQHRIFIDGQTPWTQIITRPGHYWQIAMEDTRDKYIIKNWREMLDMEADSLKMLDAPEDSLARVAYSDSLKTRAATEALNSDNRFEYVLSILNIVYLLISFLLLWLLARLVCWPVFRFVKPLKEHLGKYQKRYIALLIAILLYVLFNAGDGDIDTIFEKARTLSVTFVWLLAAIVAALLIRVNNEKLKYSIKLYRPTIFLALAVIGCRVAFMPNAMMNFIFPPLLLVFFFWQMQACIRLGNKVDSSDRFFSWTSLVITGVAMVISIIGYIFVALLVLVWWYFQMAAIHTMITLWYLLRYYKVHRLQDRLVAYRERITFLTNPKDKEPLMIGATWLYDLIKDVVLPALALFSLPLCLHLALDVFDFDDLFDSIYRQPFLNLTNADGNPFFVLSVKSILIIICLLFIFTYLNKVIHAFWQQTRYASFLRQHDRKTIHNNEINLSLGNSIISVLVWMVYITVVVLMLRIPTGSLSLVAGGLSAGIGLALKDILNNFIYGIQLMSGRLRVGDWIECDGVRGKVTSISYQSTQVATPDNTEVSFLNASLFSKNFTNLTKGNPYEFLKIVVGVAYGTEVSKVREVLEKALEVMKTKDSYGRDVVDPTYGIYVRVNEFGSSSVDISVKQYVLVAERIGYADRAREIIYKALNENGITIPFPQCDIHLKKDND